MKIRRNDTVLVIAGKDKGKRGQVHKVFPKNNRVHVTGVNVVKRHTRASAELRQAGIIESEAPLHASNVQIICGSCDKPTRISFEWLEEGTKVRKCKLCHEVIQ